MTRLRASLATALTLTLLMPLLKHATALALPDAMVSPALHCIAAGVMSLLTFGGGALLLSPWEKAEPSPQPKWLVWTMAVAAALLCRAALTPVDAAWQSWLDIAPRALPRPDGAAQYALYAVALALVPAVTEEAFFRGALLGSLGKTRWAIPFVTLLFALAHGDAATLPGTLAVSLALTVLTVRTGRLSAAILMHLAYNLTALLPCALPGWMPLLCGAGLVALLTAWMLRLPKGERIRLPFWDGALALLTLLAAGAVHMI